MENKMFCFQCQETAKGTGCTLRGVCGKLPETSRWQDLLLSVVRGVATIGNSLNEAGVVFDKTVVGDFLTDALFATITNANFDDTTILEKVDRGIVIKKELLTKAQDNNVTLPDYQEVKWGGAKSDYTAEATARQSSATRMPTSARSRSSTSLALRAWPHTMSMPHVSDSVTRTSSTI